MQETPGSIPGVGRSPAEGKGCPLQYSGLEDSVNCVVHGVTKSQTRLSDFHFPSLSLEAKTLSQSDRINTEETVSQRNIFYVIQMKE